MPRCKAQKKEPHCGEEQMGFSGIFVCSQSGYHPQGDAEKVAIIHPQEDFVKSGYKLDMKCQNFN